MRAKVAFLVAFFIASTAAYGQSLNALKVACNVASGSQDAVDTLAKMNAMPPDTPGLQDAVGTCNGKLQGLKQREDAEWTQGQAARDARNCANARQAFQDLLQKRTAYQLKARDEIGKLSSCKEADVNSSCADAASNLQKADGAMRTANWSLARSLLSPIQSCPGFGDQAKTALQTVDRTETNNRLNNEATVAIRQQHFTEACTKLNQIEATDPNYKGLAAEKSQAGGCPQQQARVEPPPDVKPADTKSRGGAPTPAPAPPPAPADADNKPQPGDTKAKPEEAKPKDELKEKYDQAVRFMELAKYQDALPILKDIQKQNKNYLDVTDRLKETQDGIKKITEGTAEQRVAEFKRQAETLLNKGEYVGASSSVNQALKIKADDAQMQQLKQKIDDAKASEDVMLTAGINAFYAGKYPESEQRLGDFLKKPHAPRIVALARFYFGAAAASEFYLTGESDMKKKDEAKQAFAQTVKAMPTFYNQQQVWKNVSSKIAALFLDAQQ